MKFVPSPGPGMPATFVHDDTPAPPPQQRNPIYVRKAGKRSHDTIEGCRENARLDLARAATMAAGNARSKYERSAASWNARADLLQRIDAIHASRLAEAATPAE